MISTLAYVRRRNILGATGKPLLRDPRLESCHIFARVRMRGSHERGAALVMTLAVLSILVILLVGFLGTMRTERKAAVAFENAQRAKLIANGAVSHAIDLLRTNIPEPARLAEGPHNAPGENWIINPGRLTVVPSNGSPRYVPLHTGEVTEAPDPDLPRDAESVDLNQPLPGQTTPVITGNPGDGSAPRPPMRVRWVNLLRDPSTEAGPQNSIVGRYAFWMDDECAKLNFNTASGKPAPGADVKFDTQLNENFPTPIFTRGTKVSTYAQVNAPDWALGRPQSVNLDVLFDDPSQLNADKLVDHLFLHGYSRYPEALLDFTTLQGTAAKDWWEREKFNLTFYSRSPEFNAFNRPRFFTTYIPLSLEAGPSYQHPFVHDPSGMYAGKAESEILHLNSLLGTFGFTSTVTDEDSASSVNGGNVVNRAQVEMMMAYMRRRWPGYSRSFIDKYGEAECRQLALNTVLMARMATTQINGANLSAFSRQYSFRTTSVNYSPSSTEMKGRTPERMYWRFPGVGKNGLFLPQTPGPHITEVRLFVKPTNATPAPKNNRSELNGYKDPRYIQYWYEVEYYMHGFGPVVDVSEFPTRVDYMEISEVGGGKLQQFGPSSPDEDRFDADWTEPKNLGRLVAQAPRSGTGGSTLTLGPLGAKYLTADVPNRQVVRSQVITLGRHPTNVPHFDNGDYGQWDPLVFDAATKSSITLEFRFRPGMSVFDAPGRPRQMIPLGETREDTLKAVFQINLAQVNRDQVVSWQISDPRLSHDLAQWEAGKQGPGSPTNVGTPGLKNSSEPSEDSVEKSKFRYILRAPIGARVVNIEYDRPDEYDPRSRITSPGYWSLLHTGMQSGVPWRTLNLGAAGNQESPPDWLFLDLVGATYPMANDQWKIEQRQPDEFSTASFMNSTAGQINLNSRIYPQNRYFTPPPRIKPLKGVFMNLPGINAEQLAKNIEAYQKDDQVFDYVGELANVEGIAGNGSLPWKKEFVLRNMAGVLTTKSNTFGVWGVAQAVGKNSRNKEYDRFERGDQMLAEKRFYAIVERYIWPGRDGVPGNAHVSSAGKWDRLAQQTEPISTSNGVPDTLFQLPGSPPLYRSGQRLNLDTKGTYAEYDGPEQVGMDRYTESALGKVKYRASSLEEAYNPPQPLIKYRVVSFKYLDQ